MKRGLALFSMAAAAILLSAGPLNAQGKPASPPARPTGPGAGPGSPGGMGNPAQSKPATPPTAKNDREQSGKGQPQSTGQAKTASEQLAQNERLSARVKDLLPPGTDINQASSGFKNLGQFVAAAHVSKNLGIPFDQLRTRVVDGKTLGDAIHEIRPDVDHKAEEKKATKAAQQDIEGRRENPTSN